MKAKILPYLKNNLNSKNISWIVINIVATIVLTVLIIYLPKPKTSLPNFIANALSSASGVFLGINILIIITMKALGQSIWLYFHNQRNRTKLRKQLYRDDKEKRSLQPIDIHSYKEIAHDKSIFCIVANIIILAIVFIISIIIIFS